MFQDGPILKQSQTLNHLIQVLDKFKDVQFYHGEEDYGRDGMVAILDYEEDGMTPFMLFFIDGVVEEKFVSVIMLKLFYFFVSLVTRMCLLLRYYYIIGVH